MKLSAIFLLLALQVTATNYAQNLNLKETNISITEVLKKIESQSEYRFYYSNDIIPADRFISVNAVNATLQNVLSEVLSGSNLVWNIINKNKVVISSKVMQGNDLTSSVQARHITGKVTDEKGTPLDNVSIIIKGTTIGTVTNSEGAFSIDIPSDNTILEVTRVGYEAQELVIGASDALVIIMKAQQGSMDEIIVVGYGTQKKATATGAANTINAKLITNRATSSVTNNLQGTVPGLTILSRPGDVGKDIATVNIRGRGNLNTSAPLFVVDGVVVTPSDFARLTPSDIENLTILKDAAAAIYGSRAAYGVVLVTTKRAKSGKAKIGYDFLYGLQSPTYLPKTLGSYDYATLYNEAQKNAGITNLRFSDADLEKIKSGTFPDLFPNNNWYDLVYKNTAPLMQHGITVSGGGDTKYYLNLSYMNQGSLIPGKDLKRYSARANTSTKVGKMLDVGTNIFFVRDDIKNPNGEFSTVSLARMVPTMVAIQSDNTWGTINGGKVDATLGKDNPLRSMKEGGRSSIATNRLLTSINATLRPVEGVTIDGQLAYNFTNTIDASFISTMAPLINFLTKKEITGSERTINSLSERWDNYSVLSSQLYGAYEKTINSHYFKIMAGTSYEGTKEKYILAGRKVFVSNDLDGINSGSAAPDNLSNEGNISEKGFASYFSRLNYSFKEKYLLEGVFRADGSSQFAPDRRWGYYPGVLAGWVISKEPFMENINWINNLKLRASYGALGNVNNVGYYDYYNLMATGTAVVLDETKVDGYWPNKLVSPTLTWEKVISKNIGLDGNFWNSKLFFQIDAFDRLTKDILLSVPQPTEFGLTSKQLPSFNAAKVSNKGFEITLGHSNNIGDLRYDISANLTKIWNKVTDLYGQPDMISNPWITRLGEAIGSFYGYKTNGLFKDAADTAAYNKLVTSPLYKAVPGNIKYVDINGDGKINSNDRTILGNDVPYFTYGLNGSLYYKGFDFSFIGQGVSDVKVYLSSEASEAFFNGAGAKQYHLERWTEANPNPNAPYPRMLLTANNKANQETSDFWLFNASYFRLKNITLGYTLPYDILKTIKASQLRLFFTANNIATIRGDHRLKDFDPEVPTSRASYPQLKTFSFGLNVNF